MIYNYKIQCSGCKSIFECEVDTEFEARYYPAYCPKCGKMTKVSLAKPKQAHSLLKSKSISYVKKRTDEKDQTEVWASVEKITFKRVPSIPRYEQKSKVILPKESKHLYPPKSPETLGPSKSEKTTKPPKTLKSMESEKSEKTTGVLVPITPPSPAQQTPLQPTTPDRDEPSEILKQSISKKVLSSSKIPGKRKKDVKGKGPEVKRKRVGAPRDEKKQRLVKQKGRLRPIRPPEEMLGEDELGEQLPKTIKPPRLLGKPETRLNLATLFLIIVFFLGIFHGISSRYVVAPESISSDIATPDSVDIQGTVIDYYSGRPIAGCEVRLGETGQRDLTNSDGYYLIKDVSIGDHEIRAEADGYSKIIKKITVASEQPANFNFELKPGVNVEVIDETIQTVEKPETENTINIFAVIMILFACFAILAIILIRMRNMYPICVISAFISIFSFGMGIGFIIGLMALILILVSSSGFKIKKKEASMSLEGPGKVVKVK